MFAQELISTMFHVQHKAGSWPRCGLSEAARPGWGSQRSHKGAIHALGGSSQAQEVGSEAPWGASRGAHAARAPPAAAACAAALQAVFCHSSGQQVVIEPLGSEEEAALACDALSSERAVLWCQAPSLCMGGVRLAAACRSDRESHWPACAATPNGGCSYGGIGLWR